MTEQTLLDYFQNKISADEFAKDLSGSQVKTSHDTTSVFVKPISSDISEEFNVTKENLIKLCDDTLSGKLTPTDLNTIAFAIITSEFFTWDNDASDANIIDIVIYDWDNPEIGFDLSLKNIEWWKHYLQTGEYLLDKTELKNKFRNDKKQR